MSISFIVPCYNSSDCVEKTIRSIASIQKLIDCDSEIIAVNDGSTDDTLEILLRLNNDYSSLRVFDQSNSGVSTARNKGISVAEFDKIVFLDSDDTIDEHVFSKHISSILDNDFCCWGAKKVWVDTGKIVEYPMLGMDDSQSLIEAICRRHVNLFIGGFSVATEIARTMLFDERYKYGEDIKFILECILKSNKLVVLDDAIMLNYYQHSNSAMANFNQTRFDSLDCLKSLEDKLPKKLLDVLLDKDRKSVIHGFIKSRRAGWSHKDNVLFLERLIGKNYSNKFFFKYYIYLILVAIKHRFF